MGHLAIVAGLFAAWYLLSIPLDQPGGILSSLNRFTVFDVIVAIMLAVSLNLILGMTGQFSLGHAGFVAVGAYTAMVIAGKAGFFLPQLAFWHSSLGLGVNSAFVMITLTSMAGAMLVCALLGLLVGLPTLRLRGDYLAIATLGFGEIVATLITNSEYLGRALGLQLKTSRREWVTDHLDNPPPLLDAVSGYLTSHLNMISIFWAFACLTVTIMVVRNIKYSTTGRALMAIREDIVASEATGIPTVRYKIAAFIIGAALAGLGGALYAHYTALNPAGFRFMFSVTIVLFVILGGQGSITGSVVAAAALTILPVAIQRNTVLDTTVTEKWRMVVYALLIILAMLFMPRGIFGRYEITDLARWLWRKARSHAQGARDVDVQPPATDLPPGLATLAAENEPGELPAPLLSAEHVTMQFGGLKAVDDFNLALYPGELVGLIGPNGAGKTTVFNVLTGVYRPSEGDIKVGRGGAGGRGGGGTNKRSPGAMEKSAPRSIVRLKPHAISHLGIARTFQNIRLFGDLSVLDNVRIAQHAHHRQGIPAAILRTPSFFREEDLSRRHAMGYLGLFDLAHLAQERANALSYGDQRRLEIARALATRPRILLLDEPAAGMNPTEKRELMEMIQSLRTRFGLTILLIEHDMKVVMGICQRILVLDYGKTIASGTPEAIRRNPAVIRAYLGTAKAL
jgi:branched-chain amino acid transport system permease protein